jgi:putative hydrolase of the HAD superfamily
MMQAAPDLLYGDESDLFTLYDDVLPTLKALDELGIRIGVISNWDYSLHRVLRSLNIHDRFEHVIASLEEGWEKPDPRLFQRTLEKFAVTPEQAVHVGDNPLDDLRGAQDFGMKAFLIDRAHEHSRGTILARLTDLVPALER